MKNSKELDIERKLYLNLRNAEDMYKKYIVAQSLINIYNNIKKSLENINNIINGCAYTQIIDNELISNTGTKIEVKELEKEVTSSREFKLLREFYDDLGFDSLLFKGRDNKLYYIVHLNTEEYHDLLNKSNVDINDLIMS